MTKAEKTRQFIIEKAAPIFNQKGIAGTAISDIMQATKLAKGGIYGNFSSKEEISAEAYNFLYERLNNGIESTIRLKSSPKEKLFALLDYYRDKLALSDSGGCPMLNFGVEVDDTNPAIKKSVGKSIIASQSRLKDLINEGVKSGHFTTSVNAETFAIMMFNLLEGSILASRVLGNNRQIKVVIDILKGEIEKFSN
jgi:AcrR family transcriptional regulator